MSIFSNAETVFEAFWNDNIKPFLHDDVEPQLKAFIQQFDSAFGKQALIVSLSAVSALESGANFGATALGLATTLYNDAKADAAQTAELDATQILQTVQSALSVAKAANNIVTPGDAAGATEIITPAAPASPPDAA